MTDIFLNDPVAIRHCILYEFVGGVPVFEAWKNFCKKIGENVISYVDYEYWYMRFAQKQFDLNHDRSEDPATRNICNMPVEIIDMIFNKLKPMERFVARKVCKKFRTCFDDHALEFSYIAVFPRYVRYDRSNIVYYHNRFDNCVVKFNNKERVIENENSAELMIHDVLHVLKNSKLPLKELKFSLENEMFVQLEKLATQNNTPVRLSTCKLRIIATGEVPVEQFIFSMVKFDVLTIDLCENAPEVEKDIAKAVERVRRICELTATKQHVTFLLDYFDALPIQSFLNFKSITLAPKELTSTKVIGNYLKILLTSTAIEHFCLMLTADSVAIKKFITNQLQLLPVDDETNKFRSPISATDEFYSVVVEESSIEIIREVMN